MRIGIRLITKEIKNNEPTTHKAGSCVENRLSAHVERSGARC